MAAYTTVDVVAVLDKSFRQVFADARPMKASVKEESKVMQHPVENGTSVVDHRVLAPVEIKLSMLLTGDSYRNTYQQIKQYYLRAELFTVQTTADTYQNMLIASIPHEESPELSDAIAMEITFSELKIAATKYSASGGGRSGSGSNKSPRDNSTTGRGQQQGPTASSSQEDKASSVLYGIFS
ncbi:hypothetical protein GPN87_003093 [Salmonella enterica]|nr:hypothetical protein [Salmonella enterica]EDR9209876.1 hypothetical protein [Salmonella enterica subsp. enterica serovar Telelkebir]EAP6781880.1 hypothetical protein [Salmonella enterica]EAR5015566.1 hypothetical protein [Salmonella enterica]EAU6334845.1 hypothetical protein [Salmonella enterica]